MKTCPSCGELNGNERDVCYKCGGLLPGPDIAYEEWVARKTAEARKIVKIRATAIVTLCVVVLTLLCLNLIPIQRRINRTLNGVSCRLGSQAPAVPVAIAADGTYTQYLLHWLGKADTYSGKLVIPGYPETVNGFLSVSFYYFSDHVYASPADGFDMWANSYDYTPMIYWIFSNSPGEPLTTSGAFYLGNINCTPDFSRLFIRVYEPVGGDTISWGVNNGLIICCPAGNRAEAVQVAKSFTLESGSVLTQTAYWVGHPNGE